MRLIYLLPLFVFVIVAAFFWQGLKVDPHVLPSVLINKKVPDFAVSSLDDQTKKLTQNIFKGQVSLVNVWATWCSSCYEEQAVMMDIANSNQVRIIGVDFKDKAADAKKWLNQMGNPYAINLFDDKGILGINLGVYGTPETFLVDQKGVIRDKVIGAVTKRIWLDKLLPEILQLRSHAA